MWIHGSTVQSPRWKRAVIGLAHQARPIPATSLFTIPLPPTPCPLRPDLVLYATRATGWSTARARDMQQVSSHKTQQRRRNQQNRGGLRMGAHTVNSVHHRMLCSAYLGHCLRSGSVTGLLSRNLLGDVDKEAPPGLA